MPETPVATVIGAPDFNWGAVIYTMCITPVRITPASRILFTYKSAAELFVDVSCRFRRRHLLTALAHQPHFADVGAAGLIGKQNSACRRDPSRQLILVRFVVPIVPSCASQFLPLVTAAQSARLPSYVISVRERQ